LAKVHALSIVDPKAELADDVEVGPFCIVESDVVIGAGSKLESHVVIKSGTSLGSNNILAQGVVLGGDPQDRKYQGEPTFLKIGDGNMIREYVTIHRATGEGRSTVIGNDCYIMAYSHFGHNCVVHDHVTVANLAAVSGHVTIEELVTIGGMVGIHQWVRVGKVADALVVPPSALQRDGADPTSAQTFVITAGKANWKSPSQAMPLSIKPSLSSSWFSPPKIGS